MGLLGLLVADQGEHLSGGAVDAMLLLNPADAYRLFNLAGLADVRLLSGMAALGGESGLSPPLLLAALLAWALVPLAAAAPCSPGGSCDAARGRSPHPARPAGGGLRRRGQGGGQGAATGRP